MVLHAQQSSGDTRLTGLNFRLLESDRNWGNCGWKRLLGPPGHALYQESRLSAVSLPAGSSLPGPGLPGAGWGRCGPGGFCGPVLVTGFLSRQGCVYVCACVCVCVCVYARTQALSARLAGPAGAAIYTPIYKQRRLQLSGNQHGQADNTSSFQRRSVPGSTLGQCPMGPSGQALPEQDHWQ